MTMKTCVLRDMAPDEVRRRLEAFTASYVVDWEDWLGVAESNQVSKFASILRSWNATRPLPMRRPKAESSHEPPYIEQLIDEAEPHLKVLGDLCVTDLASATPAQIAALVSPAISNARNWLSPSKSSVIVLGSEQKRGLSGRLFSLGFHDLTI